MKVQVLGCSAVELPHLNLPGFLVEEKILLDAGTIGSVLNESMQCKIRHVLITHAHIDHVKDLPFFADYISMSRRTCGFTIFSIAAVNAALKKHLLNDVLWPDFSKIPNIDNPVIRYTDIEPGKPFTIDSHRITAFMMKHTVDAAGFLVENRRGKRLFYAGDTGPSDSFFSSLEHKLDGLIIEVSFPNRLENAALETGHLTPKLLAAELNKFKFMPDNICITHFKPMFRDTIRDELKKLNIRNIRILRDGGTLVL